MSLIAHYANKFKQHVVGQGSEGFEIYNGAKPGLGGWLARFGCNRMRSTDRDEQTPRLLR